jgi:group I intron endonuclease
VTFKIYKITNTINGKGYVGFTSQSVSKRFNQHCHQRRKSLLYHAIQKYGAAVFTIETLFESPDKEHTLSQMEEKFIREHHTHVSEHGYNLNYGGCASPVGKRPHTKWNKTRHKKMSKMFKAIDKSYMRSDKYKTIMRAAKKDQNTGAGNPMFGKRGSDNPNSRRYSITHPDGTTYTIHGGDEKRQWLREHHISPNTFQKMVHHQLIHLGLCVKCFPPTK